VREESALSEQLTVVSDDDDGSWIEEPVAVEPAEQSPELVVREGDLGEIGGPEVVARFCRQLSLPRDQIAPRA
jgi:hypothetical protein